MGRPQKPYKTSWGELIPGLYRRHDGRWKVIATGEMFTEHDEYTAIAKFKQRSPDNDTVFISTRLHRPKSGNAWQGVDTVADVSRPDVEDEFGYTGHLVDERSMWEMVRKIIIETPDIAAKKLRIPQIASLKSLELPPEPLRLYVGSHADYDKLLARL